MRFLGLAAAMVLVPSAALAFCGFYVPGEEGTKLFNDATEVVLMRDGIRTVLSMQNDYAGPPEGFAMVVPVPVVLKKENVKTLPKDVFDRIDKLASPRLVEYWEQDPCPTVDDCGCPIGSTTCGCGHGMGAAGHGVGVAVEAQFAVGEYEIVVLSASDSIGLDTWLRANHYAIPSGAEPYLRPYVQQGMKFFVAKVDPAKVTFENGRARLSPLRFHYDTEQFHLPIRLGLINSQGSQDLIVNILARLQRYDVANYENVAIPTNIDVADGARKNFGAFYTKLFEETLAKHPHAVVTEYAWQAVSCDPCPVTPLTERELATLGGDTLANPQTADFVLTRLHVRYGKDALGDDLFFRAAPPIQGGREHIVGAKGKLEEGALPSGVNNFQARYAIRHPWTGPMRCAYPTRGVWGGPPGGVSPKAIGASNLGLQKPGALDLAMLVKGPIPSETFLSSAGPTPLFSIGNVATDDVDASTFIDAGGDASASGPPSEIKRGGCAACSIGDPGSGLVGAGFVGLLLARLGRRRKR
jgi:hypothetical protein